MLPMLEEIIRSYLAKTKNIPLEKFDDPNLQVSALGLDSLDMVEMLFEIEDRCGFQLADPTRYPNMSFKEMIAAIEAEIREHNNGELPELNLEANK
jgi:acyl carrier protein